MLTEKEEEIINKIIDIHNLYVNLNIQHPSDLPEWCTHIHGLQKLIGMRILRREHPEIFPIKS